MPIECVRCGGTVTGRRDAAYCSNACRQRAYRDRRRSARVEAAGVDALRRLTAINDAVIRNAPVIASRNA